MFPSCSVSFCSVLIMSRGFIVGLGRLSGIVFIINTGEVGLPCLP